MELVNNYKLQFIDEINFHSWSFIFNKLLIEMEMIISGYSPRIKN